MVAAEALTSLQGIAASTFAADELALGPALHRRFAHQTPLAIETAVTAARAEGVALIGNRRR
jgi:hypothetical protein